MSKSFLSICAVVKNEALYIEEWLAFHIVQGFTKFFIYDNESTDDTVERLKPFIDKGYVIYYNIKEVPCQFIAYNHCIKHHKIDAEWCAFLDVDEFFHCERLPFRGGYKALTFIENFSTNFLPVKSFSALNVNWILYGSNGRLAYSPEPVIERFTSCSNKIDQHTKALTKLEDTIRVGKNPHYMEVKGITIDDKLDTLDNFHGLLPNRTDSLVLRINHYHTKSKNEYFERKLTKPDPGTGRFHDKDRMEEIFKAHDVNESLDLSAFIWLSEVNKVLERIKS